MGQTALILLAAGCSSRMGSPKQLLPYKGKPLLRHAADVALQSHCNPVIVVLGAQSGEVEAALEGLAVEIAFNKDWEAGMGTSIHAGVRAAEAQEVDGLILFLGDQPLISPEVLNRLIATHRATGQPIVASQYSGTVGVPVYFAREFFPALLGLKPEQGCKGLILSNASKAVRLDCPEAETDVDTPNDYERVQR